MTAETVEIPGYIAGTWDIDPVHSHVGFVARHLMVSKAAGTSPRSRAGSSPQTTRWSLLLPPPST
jgi:hypothetical protein